MTAISSDRHDGDLEGSSVNLAVPDVLEVVGFDTPVGPVVRCMFRPDWQFAHRADANVHCKLAIEDGDAVRVGVRLVAREVGVVEVEALARSLGYSYPGERWVEIEANPEDNLQTVQIEVIDESP